MPDSVRVRYPLSLIVFPKPESNSFPKLRLVDFYSHHATPPPTVVPCQRIHSTYSRPPGKQTLTNPHGNSLIHSLHHLSLGSGGREKN